MLENNQHPKNTDNLVELFQRLNPETQNLIRADNTMGAKWLNIQCAVPHSNPQDDFIFMLQEGVKITSDFTNNYDDTNPELPINSPVFFIENPEYYNYIGKLITQIHSSLIG